MVQRYSAGNCALTTIAYLHHLLCEVSSLHHLPSLYIVRARVPSFRHSLSQRHPCQWQLTFVSQLSAAAAVTTAPTAKEHVHDCTSDFHVAESHGLHPSCTTTTQHYILSHEACSPQVACTHNTHPVTRKQSSESNINDNQ